MAEVRIESLSASIRREIERLRPELRNFTRQFAVVAEKRKDLAPRFMRTYNQISAEADGFTFVEYVRLFDATVPTQAAGENGYRVHPTYMAADYLRRLTRQRPRGRQGVRDNATDALARSLRTILNIIKPETHAQVWAAVQAEFGLTQRTLTGLKRRVEATEPLFKLPTLRPVAQAEVIHMERQRPAVEGEGEAPAAAPARRKRAA